MAKTFQKNANNPNPILKSYDIVAVQPTNEKIFHECCTTLDLDIITFDLSQKLDYKLKKTPLQAAITRGIYFELNISAALSGIFLILFYKKDL